MADSGWIKCCDRLPDEDGKYLVYRSGYAQTIWVCDFDLNFRDDFDEEDDSTDRHEGRPCFCGEEWDCDGCFEGYSEVRGITHWMPLPEEPKN